MGFLFSKPKVQQRPDSGAPQQVGQIVQRATVVAGRFDYDGVLSPSQYAALLANTLQPPSNNTSSFYYALPEARAKRDLPSRPTVRIVSGQPFSLLASFWEDGYWQATGRHGDVTDINSAIYDGAYPNLAAFALAVQARSGRSYFDGRNDVGIFA